MEFLERLRARIDQLELKEFYTYTALFLGILCLIAGGVAVHYYIKIGTYRKQIKRINRLREDVKLILDRYERVKKQRAEVDALLEADEDFILEEYLEGLRAKLQLTFVIESRTTAPRDEIYQEIAINAKFTDMNMKQLTQLLQELEKVKRIYTKELEIIKSKTKPGTIDVSITIATLKKATAVPE